MNDWNGWLVRWADAGLIDAATAQQIRAYETAHAGTAGLRWPILIALGFGGLMLGGGVLLFVAAHWDALSPGQRFGLVLLLVAGFHVAGALVAERFQGLSTALHAVGTAAFGAGIALAGQIFNLDEHWPAGILMWAVGAGAGWWVLRQLPQLALLSRAGTGMAGVGVDGGRGQPLRACRDPSRRSGCVLVRAELPHRGARPDVE